MIAVLAEPVRVQVLLSLNVIRQSAACNEPRISLLSDAFITVFPVCRFILRSLELLNLICVSAAVTFPVTRDESLIFMVVFPAVNSASNRLEFDNIYPQVTG